MSAATPIIPTEPRENLFSAGDVESILRELAWIIPAVPITEPFAAWIARAASLLGPQAVDRAALADLLTLVFVYDAAAILREPTSHEVLSRDGARAVIRALALEILGGTPVDSDRFKVIIESLKEKVPARSRDLFLPIRLALAGCAGGGELDRVILLLDSAAGITELAPVKGTRARMIEFCAALE
ncbi:MAG: hypothetical protein WAM91_06655 [Candidatus Acidiferrales bacterium]